MSKVKSYVIVLLFILSMLILSNCATTPDLTQERYPGLISKEGSLLLVFPLENDIYLFQNLVAFLLPDAEVKRFIDRTYRVSIMVDNNEDPDFSILAEGRYPRFFVNRSFKKDEAWERVQKNDVWWERQEEGLSLAFPSNHLAVMSTSDLTPILENLRSSSIVQLPFLVMHEMGHASLVGYMKKPSAFLLKPIGLEGQRDNIKQFWFSFTKQDNKDKENFNSTDISGYSYELQSEILFSSHNRARRFAALLRIALLVSARESGADAVRRLIDKGKIIVYEDGIYISGVEFSIDELSSLFIYVLNSRP